VKSDHGRGSTFSFDLPFDIPEEEDINDEFLEKEYKVNENYKEYKKKVNSPNLKNVDSSSSIQSLTNMSNIPYGSPSNPKILVVDDDQIGLFVISKYLESFGLRYKTVSDGKKAIDAVLNEKGFNLVLMDCNMPIMSGYEASRKIKDLIYKKKIAPLLILALTANTSTKDIDECKESGMNDYMPKPVSKKNLKEKLEEILKIKIVENDRNLMKEKFNKLLHHN
jgi:CheY-like chemotaxis protein